MLPVSNTHQICMALVTGGFSVGVRHCVHLLPSVAQALRPICRHPCPLSYQSGLACNALRRRGWYQSKPPVRTRVAQSVTLHICSCPFRMIVAIHLNLVFTSRSRSPATERKFYYKTRRRGPERFAMSVIKIILSA